MNINDNGTFSFCSNCPTNGACCTGKGADMPVLLPHDIQVICQSKNLSKSTFVNRSIFSNVRQMKRTKGACYFYQDNRCSIYDIRPLDCRLFPFDLKKNDAGNYDLVVYNTHKICNLEDCVEPFINDILTLINNNKDYLLPYLTNYTSNRWSKLLNKIEYFCLRPDVIVV